MAIYKTDQERGRTVVRISPEPGTEWIYYQKEMVVHGRFRHLPPAEETGDGVLEYRPAGVPLDEHLKKHPEDLVMVIDELKKIPFELEEALLDAGQCGAALSQLFWDQKNNRLQVIYIPEESDLIDEEWLEAVAEAMVQLGIDEKWEVVEVCICYEFLYKVWFGQWDEPEEVPDEEDLLEYVDNFDEEEDDEPETDPDESEDAYTVLPWEDDNLETVLRTVQEDKSEGPFSWIFNKKSRSPR